LVYKSPKLVLHGDQTTFFQEHIKVINEYPLEDSYSIFNMFKNAETIGHIYKTNTLMNTILSLLPRKVM
jgi:hypothetical protein